MNALFLLWFNELGLEFESGFYLVVLIDMGCGGSKVDDSPLVIRCRERKELIRAAAEHRYSLSSAHLLYFRSLKDVGEALRRFVDEEFVNGSPLDSPVLSLPSYEGKNSMNKNVNSTSRNIDGSNNKSSSSSNSGTISHGHSEDDFGVIHDSHLHVSSSSDSELGSSSGHIRVDDSPEIVAQKVYPPHQTAWEPYGSNPAPQSAWRPYGYGMNPPPQTDWRPYGMNVVDQPYQTDWGGYGGNSNSYAYYMKRSAPAVRTVIHGEEPYTYSNSYSSYSNESGGFFGFPMSTPREEPPKNRRPSPPAGPPPPPPPPPPPSGSGWDFFNPFDGYDNGYPAYYSQSAYGYGSIASSPDSNVVREREGIPDLEEETENEVFVEGHKGKKVNKNINRNFGESTSKAIPSRPPQKESSSRTIRSQGSEGSPRKEPFHGSEESSRAVPSHSSKGNTKAMSSEHSEGTAKAGPSQNSEAKQSVYVKEEKNSPDTILSRSSDDSYVQKKGVTFEVEEVSVHDVESSKTSSMTTLSTHGTRDIQEVVSEIRNEFEMASNYGKEVALMLEVGKVPYLPKFTVLKVAVSKILCHKAPSSAPSQPPSRQSVRVDSRTMKLARSYYDSGKDIPIDYGNISTILEELYAWEKKLYKEVKGEERLRLIYEKLCKKLKALDENGAESRKIDATEASIRNLLTKLNVCVRGIGAISSRIHKLRDEELQPQITKLIHSLIRMWKLMLKCHQKQFQSIMESKTRTLRANTGFRKDSRLRATLELEMELRTWCCYFDDWIKAQKSYVKSLNEWLLRCLHYEREETPDGVVPFSPGRIGAPPIFILSNDWHQAMEEIKEVGVANAMHNFASNLRQLWERQDEEQRHRLKAEYLSKDFTKRMEMLRVDQGKLERNQDAMSDKTMVASESGVSTHDDLKVDLNVLRKRLMEERARHKDAMILVHDAASSSLQGGLVPIFKALENFTSEALKAHEQVRFTLPKWAEFDLGRAPIYWKTMNGLPPTSGEKLKVFYNPAATKLVPNEEFGIAFNGGFNQPIMCGGEPRVMLCITRGKADPPIYTIQICIPKHATNLIFSFTNGTKWDGPYRLQFQVPKNWRNKPVDFFNEGLAKELNRDGACEKAIFPDTNIVVDRCAMIGNLTVEGGDRCELDLVTGCTNPSSPLYNPLANVDDGSCPLYSDSED